LHLVQRRGDRGRAEPDVRIREPIGDAAANRLAIGREERGARGGRARPGLTVRVAGAPPDGLRRIRRMEDLIGILSGCHLIEGR
jgi:hypothetical protein